MIVPDHLRKHRYRPRRLQIDHEGFSDWFFGGTHKEGHCIIWDGAVAHSGYPHIRIYGKLKGCHHVAYFLHYSKWPEVSKRGVGRDVLTHSCDRKNCVNFKHLRILPNAQNVIDGYARRLIIARTKNVEP